MRDGHAVGRREALRRLALGGAAAAAAPLWVTRLAALADARGTDHLHRATQVTDSWTPRALDSHQHETVTTLAELIIPETDTPGARAAQVDRFIDAVLADADPAERASFLRGLGWIDARARDRFGAPFVSCQPDQQVALLTPLSSPGQTAPDDLAGVDFFTAIKAMTITGYYTSEIGMREELGDDGVRFFMTFEGCDHPEHR